LFCETDGSIGGVIQVFSSEYEHSTCIEGHAATIAHHTFPGRLESSRVLIVAKKLTNKLAKLSITELGPQKNFPLVSRMESFSWTNHEDIPSLLVCSSGLGMIYLLTKLGSLFVFDFETCAPILLHHRICPDIVFQAVLDTSTQGVIAIARNGQVLKIEVDKSNYNQQQHQLNYNGIEMRDLSQKTCNKSRDKQLTTEKDDNNRNNEIISEEDLVTHL